MQKWEYLTIRAYITGRLIETVSSNGKDVLKKVKESELSDYINKLGTEGWEMINGSLGGDFGAFLTYFFKRSI